MISMFGIPNCDTVKKARTFLQKNNIDYNFIDFKKIPPNKQQIEAWSEYLDELPVNKKGTTYRKHKEQYELLSMSEKIDFIIANPSIVKRPILMNDGQTLALGFDEKRYQELID